MTQCIFKKGSYNCGSYAFNLYKEDIDQGSYCDRHYWQDQAQKVRADEREACAKEADEYANQVFEHNFSKLIAHNIRARGEA